MKESVNGTYCKISFQLGCSPRGPGRLACSLHGSSKMQASGPNSLMISFCAKRASSARGANPPISRLERSLYVAEMRIY